MQVSWACARRSRRAGEKVAILSFSARRRSVQWSRCESKLRKKSRQKQNQSTPKQGRKHKSKEKINTLTATDSPELALQNTHSCGHFPDRFSQENLQNDKLLMRRKKMSSGRDKKWLRDMSTTLTCLSFTYIGKHFCRFRGWHTPGSQQLQHKEQLQEHTWHQVLYNERSQKKKNPPK